jgi:uncharacterized protein (TIGR03435 family)
MRIAVTVLIVTGIVAAPPVRAQSPVFEVTSVKVHHSGDGSSSSPNLRNGRLFARNTTFKSILQVAYGLSALQVTGPDWIESDRFDLEAKAPEGVPDSEVKPMLQALLKDRFQLAANVETRELQAYDLVVAKDGLKIFLADDPEHLFKMPPRNGAYSVMTGTAATMDQLANQLASPAGRPVVNRTGLTARYWYALGFSPLSTQSAGAADSSSVDIFAALEQQLGLKLESKKESLDVLIVDHAERVPTEN